MEEGIKIIYEKYFTDNFFENQALLINDILNNNYEIKLNNSHTSDELFIKGLITKNMNTAYLYFKEAYDKNKLNYKCLFFMFDYLHKIECYNNLEEYCKIIEKLLNINEVTVDFMDFFYHVYGNTFYEKYKQLNNLEKSICRLTNNYHCLIILNAKHNYLKKAINYFEKGFNVHSILSIKKLALIYKNEYKNINKAIEYYKKSIALNDIESMLILARIYKNELNDHSKYMMYIKMAADNKNIDSILVLIHYYKINKLYNDFEKYMNIGLSIDSTQIIQYLYCN